MRPYIFGLRGGVYIIDLQKTQVLLQEALKFVYDMAAQGKNLLFVGTKRQAQEIIVREAVRCEMYYIHQRWLGGLMTNWATVKKSVDKLRSLDDVETGERFAHLTKKERLGLTKKRAKLDHVLAGIKELNRRPDMLFVVDTRREHIAVAEANKLGIPVVGLIDTNTDPTPVDFPIPANDDAIRSIELFATKIADAMIEGRNQWKASRPERTSRTTRRRGAATSSRGSTSPTPAPAPASVPARVPADAAPAEGDAPTTES